MPSQRLSRGQGLTLGQARYVCDAMFEQRYRLLWRMLLVISLVVFTGCGAAYRPQALTTQHPAHPEAVAAPELPASKTLAYTPSDIPSSQPTTAAAREQQNASPSELKGAHTVVGEGKVIAAVPSSSEIVLTHGAITGFMDAMTMGYAIQPTSLLAGVQAGDAVRFTIDTEQKAIIRLEKLNP